MNKLPPPPIKKVELKGRVLHIFFPNLITISSKVKTLSHRRFCSKPTPHWEAPLTANNIEKLINWGFELSPKLEKWWDLFKVREQNIPKPVTNIPGFKGKLMPFQEEGVGFYEAHHGRVINADDMGLGKTFQTLAWLQLRRFEAFPALIACPSAVKYMWAETADALLPNIKIQVIEGLKENKITKSDITIVNYRILGQNIPCPKCKGDKKAVKTCDFCNNTGKKPDVRSDIKNIRFRTVVADEFHKLGNEKNQRHVAFKKLCKRANFRIGLTGTPVENQILDIYRLLSLIDPSIFPNWVAFVKRYCNAKKSFFGWDTSGKSNIAELNRILANSVMLRRKKTQVLRDFPTKTRSIIPVNVDQTIYQQAVREAEHEIPIVRLTLLKQAAGLAKIKASIEWIEDFIASGEKLIIFAYHQQIIDILMKKFNKIAVKIDGKVSSKKKREAELKFQYDPTCQLCIANILAGGVGLTLTASANVCFVELSGKLKPTDHEQAEDRAWRISQSRKVTCYYLIGRNTIEEAAIHLIDKKSGIIHAALEGLELNEENTIQFLLDNVKGINK